MPVIEPRGHQDLNVTKEEFEFIVRKMKIEIERQLLNKSGAIDNKLG